LKLEGDLRDVRGLVTDLKEKQQEAQNREERRRTVNAPSFEPRAKAMDAHPYVPQLRIKRFHSRLGVLG
jgi:hypothetical protein